MLSRWIPLLRHMALLCLLPLSITAQPTSNWKIQHITTSDGLSNRFVNAITQDHRGYTWIGTNFGLNRYDGHRIDVLTRETHHLQTNSILGLFADAEKNIWVIHRVANLAQITGIDILDPISFQVKTLEDYFHASLPFTSNEILSIESDLMFNIYILTDQNIIFRYNKNGWHQLIELPRDRSVAYMKVNTGALFLRYADQETIEVYRPDGTWVNRHTLPDPADVSNDPLVTWICLGEVSPGKEFMVLQNEFGRVRYYAMLDSSGFHHLQQIDVDTCENLLLGFNTYQDQYWGHDCNGIYWLDPIENQKKYPAPGRIFTTVSVYNDSLGNMWVGTNEGVVIFAQKPKYFTSYLSREVPDYYSCRGFAETARGDIYMLTYNGNLIFHPETQTFDSWSATDKIIGLGLAIDHHGDIWISGESNNIFQYNFTTRQLQKWKMDVPAEYFSAWCIQQIRQKDIWTGTLKGLWIKNPDDDQLPKKFDKLNGYDILNTSATYHMLDTKEGVWLFTDNGLFLVDPERGVLEHVSEQNSGLPNKNLLYLHQDKEGIFWIASRGGGLFRWDRERNVFRSYTINEGLSHNVIYSILEDEYGFLWMSSDQGLMRFEKASGTCRIFLQPEGIPHEEFNRCSYLKDSQGNFYFGGLNGFVKFHPRDLQDLSVINLPVMLTRFEAINEKTGESQVLTYEAAAAQEIRLDPRVSSFLIHYSILDYDDPKLKRFAYRIDGLNTNWTYVTENFIRLNGLKGGEYTIRIKGQSSAGKWSDNELTIPVTILKPLMARWYAQAVLLLILLALVYLFYKRRTALQKAKLEREMAINQQLRHVDKLKDQFLANTSHELRTPLNGIVGLSESLLEKIHTDAEVEDLELIIASGRRLSNLVNDILDFSRLKEHDLQLKKGPVDIRAVADLCLRMNRQLITGKNVALQNNVPENIPYCLADENRLQQILQNLVANAIKFTHSGSITIDAEEVDGMIMTRVSDTGIGIAKEKQETIFREFEQEDGSIAREYGGTGLGLSISKYLVELHGGQIGVESEAEKGSVFWFSMPTINDKQNHDSSLIGRRSYFSEGDEGGRVVVNPESSVSSPNGDHLMQQKLASSHIGRRSYFSEGDEGGQEGLTSGISHILVVDDEPVNLRVLKNHLERAGYLVTLASDGHEALHLIEDGNHYHLVLLDVMMPRMSGYEVCQKLRERYPLTDLPVIMVTAKNQISDLVEGLGIGANDYIVKPFSKDELLARVKTQLDQYVMYEATNRFVPHEFIHTLGRHSIMDLHRGDMVEQNVHVMFSDIRDYTSLAEDMTPRENFKFVNALAGKVGPIVKENHGMINQYLGDTIMMLFMQKADDGVQAGVDILRMIRQYNTGRLDKNRKLIRLGIGLHSGPLMMGIIGDSMRTDAAVISDTVNTASRMEGLTKHFNVNFILSGDTLLKLEDRDRFNLRYLGKVQAKGKNLPIDVYECFDGDTTKQIELKKASLSDFQAGLEAYYAKDMMEARSFFDAVYQKNPMDLTSFGYLHKIHGFMVNGLPENWNGVEVMQSK